MHAHARAPVHSFTSLSVHCFLSSPSLSLTWYKESFSSFSHTLYCAALIPFSSSLSIFPFTVSEAVTDIGEKQSIGSSFQHPHAWTRTQTNTAAAWMRTCNNSTLTRGALLWYSRRWALCVYDYYLSIINVCVLNRMGLCFCVCVWVCLCVCDRVCVIPAMTDWCCAVSGWLSEASNTTSFIWSWSPSNLSWCVSITLCAHSISKAGFIQILQNKLCLYTLHATLSPSQISDSAKPRGTLNVLQIH